MNKYIPIFLKHMNLLDKINFNYPSTINGIKFNIPIIKKMGWTNLFMPEMWMIPLLKKFYRYSDGIFIDVGANIGQVRNLSTTFGHLLSKITVVSSCLAMHLQED